MHMSLVRRTMIRINHLSTTLVTSIQLTDLPDVHRRCAFTLPGCGHTSVNAILFGCYGWLAILRKSITTILHHRTNIIVNLLIPPGFFRYLFKVSLFPFGNIFKMYDDKLIAIRAHLLVVKAE